MKILSTFGVLLLSLVGLSAQIKVEVAPVQDQFLPNEPLIVAVRVANSSGQTLHLGADADWIKMSVESRNGFIVSKLSDPPVQGEFTLDSSKVAVVKLDLEPCFNLTRPGRYTVTANVRIKDWDQEFASAPSVFDIIDGSKLWEHEFGVPASPGATPEVRKYALQQANYLKQLKLYLRVTDPADSKVFRVTALGSIVSFSQPEPQMDRASNLHVLWQTGARGFAYRVVNPDGEIIVSQTYDILGTRPKLSVSEGGKISVTGGQRRFTHDDFPVETPVAPTPTTNSVAAPQP